jgi:hypothetical protein
MHGSQWATSAVASGGRAYPQTRIALVAGSGNEPVACRPRAGPDLVTKRNQIVT